MFNIDWILEKLTKIRTLCILLTYAYLCFGLRVFYLRRSKEGTTITVSKSKLKYVQSLVYTLFHAVCLVFKLQTSFSNYKLQEDFYNFPLYGVMIGNAVNNHVMLLRNDYLLLETFKLAEIADDTIERDFGKNISYKYGLLYIVSQGLYLSFSFLQGFLSYYEHVPIVPLLLHAASFIASALLTAVPLIVNQLFMFYSYRMGRLMEEQIRKMSAVELRKYIVIDKFGCIMKLNGHIVRNLNISNRICRLNVVMVLYLVFYSWLYIMIFMNTIQFWEDKDIKLMALGLLFNYLVTIRCFSLYQNQCNIANAVIEFVNTTKDPDIDLIRRNFLQQLLHQKVDSTGFGMFEINPALLLTVVKAVTTGTMFIYKIFPQLLDGL